MSKYFPNFLLKYPRLIIMPQIANIEPTNICNLRCPLCANKNMKRKKGYMTLSQFKYIIDEINSLKEIVLGITGEPLLNKDIFRMVKYASDKGINVRIQTNALTLDQFEVDEILNSGLHSLNISFDGAQKKTYETYRVGSDFDRVLKSVTKLAHTKRQRKLKYPTTVLQFLVMKHNEHEIPKIKELAKKIKTDYLLLKSTALWVTLTKNDKKKLAKKWLPKKYLRYDNNLNIKGSPQVCPFLFDNFLILWNGDISLCCLDFEGKFVLGNIFKEPFKKIFRNKKYTQIRRLILNKKLEFCNDCELTNMKFTGERIKIK